MAQLLEFRSDPCKYAAERANYVIIGCGTFHHGRGWMVAGALRVATGQEDQFVTHREPRSGGPGPKQT